MTIDDFDALYRGDPDPWSYTSSDYERDKYAATLEACGTGPFDHGLELGASIGVFSELLADRCGALTTLDAAPTAVAAARHRLAGDDRVEVILGLIPEAIPVQSYDLIVASEILYYLEPAALDATLAVLQQRLAPGGRLVAVHWRPSGPERPFTAAEVHDRLHLQSWLHPLSTAPTKQYLLDVWERA
jgi:SAM-dependent methyltransferase